MTILLLKKYNNKSLALSKACNKANQDKIALSNEA